MPRVHMSLGIVVHSEEHALLAALVKVGSLGLEHSDHFLVEREHVCVCHLNGQ